MLKQPIYFISDNHFKLDIDSSEKDRRQRLYYVFEKIKCTGGTLVIGGDFFDFWFDYRYVVPSSYVDLLEQLHQLNTSEIDIHFILGNHDYWDFGYFRKKFNAAVYDGNMEFDHINNRIQVCHGDGLLKNETGYRFMKKVIRSKLCISLFRNFHADWGCWLAKKISQTSSVYNNRDINNNAIRNEMIQYARAQWDAGFTVVLLGHYHQTGIVEENGNYLIFMGDWLQHFTVSRLDSDGWWQGSWNEL